MASRGSGGSHYPSAYGHTPSYPSYNAMPSSTGLVRHGYPSALEASRGSGGSRYPSAYGHTPSYLSYNAMPSSTGLVRHGYPSALGALLPPPAALKAVVLYNLVSQNSDELTVHENEDVTVIIPLPPLPAAKDKKPSAMIDTRLEETANIGADKSRKSEMEVMLEKHANLPPGFNRNVPAVTVELTPSASAIVRPSVVGGVQHPGVSSEDLDGVDSDVHNELGNIGMSDGDFLDMWKTATHAKQYKFYSCGPDGKVLYGV